MNVITAPIRVLLRLPAYAIAVPRRVFGLSLPVRIALVLLIFLILCTVLGIVLAINDSKVESELLRRPMFITGVVLLLTVIPIAVYYTIRAWLEPIPSRFPDIDDAWKAGIAAMRENGVNVSETPLFLILGSPNDKQSDALMKASGYEWIFDPVPTGRAPLRWYATEEAIYLVCSSVGCLSRLNEFSRQGSGSAPANFAAGAAGGQDITGTLVSGGGGGGGTVDTNITGTLAGGSVTQTLAPGAEGPESTAPAAGVRGTLVANVSSTLVTHNDQSGGGGSVGQGMTGQDFDDQVERLEYVCELLATERQPVCPMNGMMMMLSIKAIKDIYYANDMAECIQRDLAAVRDIGQVCSSVTALVFGMENENGFGELVNRIGAEKSKASRFGKGFLVWNEPSEENLDALSSHACGAFEDWVYSLFREEGGLSKKGNVKLYGLLCRIRSQLQNRLRNILRKGFSLEGNEANTDDGFMMFGGCYFAATGTTPDRQAFVRSTLERMSQSEGDLQWTKDAIEKEQRYRMMTQVGLGFNALMLIALTLCIVKRFTG